MNTYKDFNTETIQGFEDAKAEDEAFEFQAERNRLMQGFEGMEQER